MPVSLVYPASRNFIGILSWSAKTIFPHIWSIRTRKKKPQARSCAGVVCVACLANQVHRAWYIQRRYAAGGGTARCHAGE